MEDLPMNLSQQQARYAGIALIALGVVAVLDLWWAIPLVLLAGGGIAIYQRQRSIGRVGEATQALLWGLGLAALFLVDFVFPGVLLLGGASLLMRGREPQLDARVQSLLARFANRRAPAMAAAPSVPQAPVAPAPQRVTIVETTDQAVTSETVRLR
jgi:hypothetical protein